MLACDFEEDAGVNVCAGAVRELDLGSRVARAGLPVLERLAVDLRDLAVSIVLMDAHARVVGSVRGDRYRPQAAPEVSCVTAPIEDPRRNSPLGAVGISCASTEVTALMLPLAQLAARTIAERMLDDGGAAHRTLLEHFLRARRRARGPIVAINGDEVLTNAAGARLVGDGDHRRIWSWVNMLEATQLPTPELRLRGGTFGARCEWIRARGQVVGAIVHLDEPAADSKSHTRDRVHGSRRPTVGWASLRSSDLSIAQLVSVGMTNGEISARLFVSPHTVDSHLRQIYRKLSITSRSELTRLVVENSAEQPLDAVS
jgi:DNA-binding CsgD family transcriptional regulator